MTDGVMKCLSCGHTWTGAAIATDGCRCGHQYVKWVNFEAKKAQYVKGNPNGLAFGGPAPTGNTVLMKVSAQKLAAYADDFGRIAAMEQPHR